MSEERRTIGPYEIIRLLGKGGMSEVYEVENPRLGSRHALMHTALSDRDRQVYRAYAMEGEDIGEVAKKFGLSRNSVSQIKTRIEKRIVAAGREMIAKEGL